MASDRVDLQHFAATFGTETGAYHSLKHLSKTAHIPLSRDKKYPP
jgi:hypothetical protein